MELFLDISSVDTEEGDYILQVYKSIIEQESPTRVFSLGVNTHPDSFFFPGLIIQPPYPSFLSKLKRDGGFNSFVARTIKKIPDAKWVTNHPFHIFSNKATQVLIASNLEFLQQPDAFDKKLFNKKNLKSALQKAAKVIVPSEHYKTLIQNESSENKIQVIKPHASPFARPLSWEEKQQVKDKYTSGKDYFVSIISGEKHEFVNLLKAFTIFKKWQQSSMQLIIIHDENAHQDFSKLETYKHKSDVHLLQLSEEEKLQVLASAYACMHAVTQESIPFVVINAIFCETPIITSDLPAIKEMAGDAALYASATNVEDISRNMITIYKDETLRKKQVEKMKELVK
ncbi:glycosyltransferase [Pinibacter aurantiacus]|uniref:Glycosyltransferase n=1 Tax=Pinibacter aurantiacus TaxID=2851599 RepID=A0A9E2SD33_9BACT|nr:glycosyltransferase [Pinibacter aurantiacus]MBV4359152.1 glycosyltransferase [Pinibacter aurantiacus]